jgi:hypothetical protein
MAARKEHDEEGSRETDGASRPSISVCETRPGTTVFQESGNTDGWIASDCAVEVRR